MYYVLGIKNFNNYNDNKKIHYTINNKQKTKCLN